MGIGLDYMDRLVKQRERLKKQRERIEAQKRQRYGHEEGHASLSKGELARKQEEQGREDEQAKRILMQKQLEVQRATEAKLRGEAITGLDELEREKIGKQSFWRGKWNRRMAKWDARARKYRI